MVGGDTYDGLKMIVRGVKMDFFNGRKRIFWGGQNDEKGV